MTAAPPANASLAFELKSAALTLVAVLLKTTDLRLLAAELQARFGDAPELFNQDPVAIDLSLVREAPEPIDFAALVQLLRLYKMCPIAAKAGSPSQMEAALMAGLSEAQPTVSGSPRTAEAVANAAPKTTLEVAPPRPTALIIDKPLRSGQRAYARGTDIIVMAAVSFGAEVIADGNVHVYAPLRGRALAGALGDTQARIFTTCMQPQLLSIAGIYRTTETELPPAVLGKAAQVRLEGEKLVFEALNN
jgi:septum site-determining protein MinC